jgi:hypothetical protein
LGTASFPHLSFIIDDVVSLQEPAEFVLKGETLMMFLLPLGAALVKQGQEVISVHRSPGVKSEARLRLLVQVVSED